MTNSNPPTDDERDSGTNSPGDSIYDPVIKVEPFEDSEIIELVKFSNPNIVVGEPVSVTPILDESNCGEETMVSINGIPGKTHTLQFTEPGSKRVHVAAFTLQDGQQKTRDQRSITIDVDEREPTQSCQSFQPIIQTRQIPRHGLTVEFTIDNADEFDAEDVVYLWDIDGRQEVVTKTPTLRHNFNEELAANHPFTTWDVDVQVQAETGVGSELGRRTVGGWNRDYLNRQRGVVELKTVGQPEVVRDGDTFTFAYELHNPAGVSVDIDTRQLEYLTTNDDEPPSGYLSIRAVEPSPLREPEAVSFSIPASSSVSRQFDVPVEDVPSDMFGIGLHFFGDGEPDSPGMHRSAEEWTEMEAFGNVYAERRYNHPLAIPIEDAELDDMLDNVDARRRNGFDRPPVPVTIPELIGNEPESLGGGVRREYALNADKHQILERLPDVTPQAETLETDEDGNIETMGDGGVGDEIPESDEAVEGDLCLPYQDPPEEGLACQLTDEFEKVYIPGRILNARKGDVILSPGSGSAIAELLMKVDPMEIYSHSGIMTEDHLELRHSTASTNWLKNQKAGAFLGKEGTEGIDPLALKYAWPGTITQSIEEAYEGSSFEGPDGNDYEICAFQSDISNSRTAGHVWPEVVKPDPRIEYEISGLRDLLNQVADKASAIDGHYRFYAYTDAEDAFDVATTGEWFRKDAWWDQTRGTVCSSLIWGAVQQLEDPVDLEMDESPLTGRDLESSDEGAVVQEDTADGLYYYYADERETAAQWLYDHYYGIAEEQSGFWGKVFTDAPDDLANQITNTFASDWSGENDEGKHSKDSDKWKNPGGGHAVSPDTIRNYWDAPSEEDGETQGLYGHSERLVYRPGRVEERRVHRWKRVEPEDATLKVTVVYDGDHVDHATVEVGGESPITDGSGEVELELSPGSYTVHAQRMKDGWHLSKKKHVQLDPGETEECTITLEEPDEMYRLISVSGSMKLLDDDWFNNPTQKEPLVPKLAQIGPHWQTKTLTWSQTVDGEVEGKITMDLEWQSDADVDIEVKMELFQNGDKELDTSESGTVPKDGSYWFTDELKSGGADNPHAWFNGTVENEISPT